MKIQTTAALIRDYKEIKELIHRMYDDIYNDVDPVEFRHICKSDGKSTQFIEDQIEIAHKWISEYKSNELKEKT